MFPKAQFLSFSFLQWAFKPQLMSQMQQVGVGMSDLSHTGPQQHDGPEGPTKPQKWKWLILVHEKGKNYVLLMYVLKTMYFQAKSSKRNHHKIM